MALINSFFIGLTLFSSSLEAKIVMPELLAKQAIANIRFLSQDGKFTYFQKNSGDLLFSSNYKIIEMIKGKSGSQYTVVASPSRKKIAILQNENFHNFYSLRVKEKIFLVEYGGTTPREVGMGAAAKLHLDDSWLSYYDYYTRTITLENTTNSALKITLKLNNRINPYFTPQIVMPDSDTIYYTDLSETGAVGLLQFKRSTGKADLIFKAKNPMIKAEICLHDNALILGLFGINFSKEGSLITKAPLPLADFSKREVIYNSPLNDIGQLICNFNKESFSFIKNFGTNDTIASDLVDLNPKTKEVKPLSDTQTITSVINMDGTLLVLDKGKYLIAKGTIDYKNVDSLKSLPPSSAIEAIKDIDKKNE